MMMNILKVLTSRFGSLEINVVRTGQSEPGITRQQLGEMLGYKSPAKAIKNIHVRNAARFDGDAKCALVKMPDSFGRKRDTYIYTFKGVLEVCRYSNQPNADAVIDWAWDTLDRLPYLNEPLAPEVGGRIYVDDYNGNEVAVEMATTPIAEVEGLP